MAAAPSTLSLYLSFIIVTTLLLLSVVIAVAVGVVNVVAVLLCCTPLCCCRWPSALELIAFHMALAFGILVFCMKINCCYYLCDFQNDISQQFCILQSDVQPQIDQKWREHHYDSNLFELCYFSIVCFGSLNKWMDLIILVLMTVSWDCKLYRWIIWYIRFRYT